MLALEEGARESLAKEWTTQMRSEELELDKEKVVRTVFQEEGRACSSPSVKRALGIIKA